MALGSELSKEFISRCSKLSSKCEEDLFRCLIGALNSLTNYEITEIHGSRHQVEFCATKNWYTKNPRCELGDILFVVYSLNRKAAKFFIMQNKVRKGGNFKRVNADLVQFELLSEYKIFWPVKSGRCSNLINFAKNKSVCLYGNFYDKAGNIDMATFTANKLDFLNSAPTKPLTLKRPKRVLEYRFGDDTISNMACNSRDFCGTSTIENFGDLIEGLYIGEPMLPNLIVNIGSFLKERSTNEYTRNTDRSIISIANDLIELGSFYIPNELEELANVDYREISRKLMLINVDKINVEI